MTDAETAPTFFRIKLFVTGEGEERFLPQLLHSLCDSGRCAFVQPQRIGQLSPRKLEKKLEMVNTGKPLSSRQEEFGFAVRKFASQGPDCLAILVDDLEKRQDQLTEVFKTYRDPLDKLLSTKGWQQRASVQFLVPMVEAYYFTNIALVNEILKVDLVDPAEDPEEIGNPKALLKKAVKKKDQSRKFDEKEDGARISKQLDLKEVLSIPETCRSLRSLVKWCVQRIGDDYTEEYQLAIGRACEVTSQQI